MQTTNKKKFSETNAGVGWEKKGRKTNVTVFLTRKHLSEHGIVFAFRIACTPRVSCLGRTPQIEPNKRFAMKFSMRNATREIIRLHMALFV